MKNEVAEIKESYEVVQNAEGKFERRASYDFWSSVVPETKEQKVKFFNLLNSADEALGMNDHVGKNLAIKDVIFNPYTRVDEETGEIQSGVLTYVIDVENKAYVTSSKSVYWTLKNAFKAFGYPHYEEGEEILVQIVKKQGQQFKYVDLKVIG